MQVKESSRLTLLQQGQLLQKVLASSRTLHQVEQDNIPLAQAFPGHPLPPGYAEGLLYVGWEDEDEAPQASHKPLRDEGQSRACR